MRTLGRTGVRRAGKGTVVVAGVPDPVRVAVVLLHVRNERAVVVGVRVAVVVVVGIARIAQGTLAQGQLLREVVVRLIGVGDRDAVVAGVAVGVAVLVGLILV